MKNMNFRSFHLGRLIRRITNWWHQRDGQMLIDGKLYDFRRVSDDEISLKQ